MTVFSEKLNRLWREDKMKEAKKLLLAQVEKYPDEYFLWTSLAQTCSGLGEDISALEFSKRALALCDDDVLVLYNHALALIETDAYKEALPFCQQILKESVESISQNGEGVKWAKSIRNDTMYLKAIILHHLGEYDQALCVLKQLLTMRERGVYSDFTKKQILHKVKTIEHAISETSDMSIAPQRKKQ